MINEKTRKISFSLLNIDTMRDNKIPELNTKTLQDHIVFLTETNIKNESHKNIITSDKNFVTKFLNVDFERNNSRVGVRYPSSLDKYINITIVSELVVEKPERKQFDKSV